MNNYPADRTPLSELRKNIIAAAFVFLAVGCGAALVHIIDIWR